jgi:hypothetical protein
MVELKGHIYHGKRKFRWRQIGMDISISPQ